MNDQPIDTAAVRARYGGIRTNYETDVIVRLADALDFANGLVGQLATRAVKTKADLAAARAAIARVEALIDPAAGMAYTPFGGTRVFDEADLRAALTPPAGAPPDEPVELRMEHVTAGTADLVARATGHFAVTELRPEFVDDDGAPPAAGDGQSGPAAPSHEFKPLRRMYARRLVTEDRCTAAGTGGWCGLPAEDPVHSPGPDTRSGT